MLIDLHTHTKRYSWDSVLDPHDLIERAKQKGLDAICLTEHDFFWDANEVRELSRQHGFLVLPGVEINTDDGHVLCFGLQAYVFGMHKTSELVRHVREAGGVMAAAHPYRRNLPAHAEDGPDYDRALERLHQKWPATGCAALELVNGRGSKRENEFSRRLNHLVGAPTVAGSDSHMLTDVGRCATEFLDPIHDLSDLIAALRAGRCRAVRLDGEGLRIPEVSQDS